MNQSQDTGPQVLKSVVIGVSIINVLEAWEVEEEFLPKYFALGIGVKQAQMATAIYEDAVPYLLDQYKNNVC